MGEEVKIVVKEERQGNAVAEAKRDLEDLQRKVSGGPDKLRAEAAANIRKQQQPGAADEKAAAAAARKEAALTREIALATQLEAVQLRANGDTAGAAALEREAAIMDRQATIQRVLGASKQDAGKMAADQVDAEIALAKQAAHRAASEKATTQELREQSKLGRGAIQAVAGQMGGGAGRLAGMGRIGGLLAALFGAKQIAQGMVGQEDAEDLQSAGMDRGYAMDAHRRRIAGGYRGSSGQSTEHIRALDDQIAEREGRRGELDVKARGAWWNPLRNTKWSKEGIDVFGFKFQGAGAREKETNEQEIERLKQDRVKEERVRKQQFNEMGGGLELEIERERGKRTAVGVGKARVKEFTKGWMEDYKRALGEGAEEGQASEMATLKYERTRREQAAGAASGLVSARSGAGDVAAASNWAAALLGNREETTASINSMHETLRQSVEQEGRQRNFR